VLNGYFFFVLATVLGFYVLDIISSLLNLSALRDELPAEFADVYDETKYAESQQYTRATTRYRLLKSTFSLVVFLAFWWLGGFGWLDELVRGWSASELIRGLTFAGLLFIGSDIIDLPFELYDTFVLEEKFGFNKTTLSTFITDRLKGWGLAIALGLPLLAVILWLFDQFGSNAWLYGWIVVSLFSLVMMYLAPTYIMPLFNKFKPLDNDELKTAIDEMSENCQFPLKEVYEIDGSKRSTKSNAFFTGLGKNKKIALFDTLIEKHSVNELVAVLAHEIGHYKKKHIIKNLVVGILQMGALFFLLGLFLNNRGLFNAFRVAETSTYCSLVLFSILFEPISQLLAIGMQWLSRKYEFEADAYAAEVTGRPEDLISGLKKLSKDNLSNLTPHPLYVALRYSHPPMLARIGALRTIHS
jgi:STE24 endopeptidase